MYRIKEAAEMLGITQNRIRYYEKKNLIEIKREDENNYRNITKENMLRLQTILNYRELGLSLKEIKSILENTRKDDLVEIFTDQWTMINDNMQKLRLMKNSVERILESIYDKDQENMDEIIRDTALNARKIMKIKNGWKDRWDFNSWAKTYDRAVEVNLGRTKIYKNYSKLLNEVFNKANFYKIKEAKVLDIGVGTGNLSKYFLEAGYDITGLDQSREMMAEAKKKFQNLKLRVGEFLKIPFDDSSFDIIVSTYAFHHLNEKEKELAIKEMMRVLKPNGKIIIGDMMFESEIKKQEILKELTQEQILEIEDEYYSDISKLKKEVKKYGAELIHTQVDVFCHIVAIEAKKR